MGILRRLLSVGVGVAASALAYKVLKDYNDKSLLEGEYVEIPTDFSEDAAGEETAEAAEVQNEEFVQTDEKIPAPQKAVNQPDDGPIVNPVQLGAAEKPYTKDGKLDPMKIASPEDFAAWDEMGCQS